MWVSRHWSSGMVGSRAAGRARAASHASVAHLADPGRHRIVRIRRRADTGHEVRDRVNGGRPVGAGSVDRRGHRGSRQNLAIGEVARPRRAKARLMWVSRHWSSGMVGSRAA
ncbi:hypothetical protein ACFYR1_18730, partial [Streptomyces canus]|uniref:hypothetical protein n=1 Tax=Streptomyces canus TaxID=58343 RepID=UPI0036CF8DC2